MSRQQQAVVATSLRIPKPELVQEHPKGHYEDHRLCSSCNLFHRVKNGPCEACMRVRCPKCRMKNVPAKVVICRNRYCRNRFEMTDEELKLYTHSEDMTHCNICGRKLRHSARDKRRSFSLKG